MKKNTNAAWSMYIDGASRGNPGPSGAGIVISKDDKEVSRHHVYLGIKTNNQAEYLALALGLFFLRQAFEKNATTPHQVTIISDSELLVRQMEGAYQIKNSTLRNLSSLISTLVQGITCRFRHVLRSENKQADKLANEGIDGKGDIPSLFINLLHDHQIKL